MRAIPDSAWERRINVNTAVTSITSPTVRGLGQRDRLIGELIALNYLDLSDLRVATQMSAGHLRRILRAEGL